MKVFMKAQEDCRYLCIEERAGESNAWVFETPDAATSYAKKAFLASPIKFRRDYDVFTLMVTRDDLCETAFADDGSVLWWDDYDSSSGYNGDFSSKRYQTQDDIAWMTISDACDAQPFLGATGSIKSDAPECAAIPALPLTRVSTMDGAFETILYTRADIFGGHRFNAPSYWCETRQYQPIVLVKMPGRDFYVAYFYQRVLVPGSDWATRVVLSDRVPGIWGLYTRSNFISDFYYDGSDGVNCARQDAEAAGDEDTMRYLDEVVAIKAVFGHEGGASEDDK